MCWAPQAATGCDTLNGLGLSGGARKDGKSWGAKGKGELVKMMGGVLRNRNGKDNAGKRQGDGSPKAGLVLTYA
jgi:hypothetical protein